MTPPPNAYTELNILADQLFQYHLSSNSSALPSKLKLQPSAQTFQQLWPTLQQAVSTSTKQVASIRKRKASEEKDRQRKQQEKMQAREKRKREEEEYEARLKKQKLEQEAAKQQKLSSEERKNEDFHAKLQQVPLVEDVSINSKKFQYLSDWVGAHDGKDSDVTQQLGKLLTDLISRPDFLSAEVETRKKQKSEVRKRRPSSETLDARLSKEKQKSPNISKADKAEWNSDEDSEEEEVHLSSDSDSGAVYFTKDVPKKKTRASSSAGGSVGSASTQAIQLDESEEEYDVDMSYVEEKKQEDESETDEEAPEEFNVDDDDVYTVECILEEKRRKKKKDKDFYLIKWLGYDELTWEPTENVPRHLVDNFHERQQLKRSVNYKISQVLDRMYVKNLTTNRPEFIYKIVWKGQEPDDSVWEGYSALPNQAQVTVQKHFRAKNKS